MALFAFSVDQPKALFKYVYREFDIFMFFKKSFPTHVIQEIFRCNFLESVHPTFQSIIKVINILNTIDLFQ